MRSGGATLKGAHKINEYKYLGLGPSRSEARTGTILPSNLSTHLYSMYCCVVSNSMPLFLNSNLICNKRVADNNGDGIG